MRRETCLLPALNYSSLEWQTDAAARRPCRPCRLARPSRASSRFRSVPYRRSHDGCRRDQARARDADHWHARASTKLPQKAPCVGGHGSPCAAWLEHGRGAHLPDTLPTPAPRLLRRFPRLECWLLARIFSAAPLSQPPRGRRSLSHAPPAPLTPPLPLLLRPCRALCSYRTAPSTAMRCSDARCCTVRRASPTPTSCARATRPSWRSATSSSM